jgi:hypothetical protein
MYAHDPVAELSASVFATVATPPTPVGAAIVGPNDTGENSHEVLPEVEVVGPS